MKLNAISNFGLAKLFCYAKSVNIKLKLGKKILNASEYDPMYESNWFLTVQPMMIDVKSIVDNIIDTVEHHVQDGQEKTPKITI